jgi:DNA-binding CsgD family transcriptional regulator
MPSESSVTPQPPASPANLTAKLTRRELEVLIWVSQGKRDSEIALILGISYRTVTNHVRAILSKLNVENRTAAVGAFQKG